MAGKNLGLFPSLGMQSKDSPAVYIKNRQPTPNDADNFAIGDFWIFFPQPPAIGEPWVLISLARGIATWVSFGAGAGNVLGLVTDDGIEAVPNPFGDIGVNGDPLNIETLNSGPNSILIGLVDNPTVAGDLTVGGNLLIPVGGATIAGTTNLNLGRGVVQSTLSGDLFANEGVDGQLLIGSNAGPPIWANLIAGAGITIANANNSVTITNSGGAGGPGMQLVEADDANQAAPDGIGRVFILGDGTNIDTTVTVPFTLNVNLNPNLNITSLTSSGNITSTGGDITANIGNVNAGGDLNVTGNVAIDSFGEGTIVSNAAGDLSSINGTAGQIIIAQGAGVQPLWGNITSTGGTITVSHPLPNTINLESVGAGANPAAGSSFHAYKSAATQAISIGVLTTVIFDTTTFNNGANYNGGTSTFIAPANGTYYFHYSFCAHGGPNMQFESYFYVNATRYSTNCWFATSIRYTVNNSIIIPLTIGQQVTVKFTGIGAVTGIDGLNLGSQFAYFEGYRLI